MILAGQMNPKLPKSHQPITGYRDVPDRPSGLSAGVSPGHQPRHDEHRLFGDVDGVAQEHGRPGPRLVARRAVYAYARWKISPKSMTCWPIACIKWVLPKPTPP